MKIKAKYFNRDVIIIDFISVYERAVKAIYVDKDGNIYTCYLDSNDLKVVDKEYLPRGEDKIAGWENDEKWIGQDGVR